jgi:D-alanine-D-alanine ligase-like ATP-grasp enzyme
MNGWTDTSMIRTALLPLVNRSSLLYRREMLSARRVFEFVRARMPSEQRTLERRFEALRSNFFDNYWAEVAQNIGADIDAVGDGFYRLSRAGKKTFVRQGEVMLDDHLTLRIAGNKPLVNRLLQERGYPVSDYLQYDLRDIDKALRFMQGCSANCVVKPASGAAGGRGVCTKINSRSRLLQASHKAAVYSSNGELMIEQEHAGASYRLLYLDGEFIDALRRESPTLMGDGHSTVQKLVEQENARRLGEGNSALSPLTMDLDSRHTLAEQGFSSRQVVAAGTRVTIKTASNQYSRLENQTVKSAIHPSIIDFGRDISRILGVTLSGVDLMLKDHTVPLNESCCRFNEINSTPGLHHHALVCNEASEVKAGSIILNYIFNKTEE